MLNGAIMPKLITFFVPLMLSSVLQLMFNAVDLIVVGRFAGSSSLAAVGATTAIIHAFTNLFMGISLGTNVCCAKYFAVGDRERMSKAVHTSVVIAVIFGILMLFAGIAFSRPILLLMDTPEEIIDKSVQYMNIYFLGMPFFMLYNFGSAVLRAVGDTKRPMVYLIIAGIVNAILNVFLVTRFNMDVAGVAIATVISQIISCVLVVITLLRCPEGYRLCLNKLKIDKSLAGLILKIGFPCGIQSTVINISNALLQSSVNTFGEFAMAGYTAANNIFGFLYSGANAITQGCMSFTGQNFGAKKYARARRVLIDSLILETVLCLVLGVLSHIFGSELIGIYSDNESVIAAGLEVLALTTVPYFLCGYMDCIPGALRGMGYSVMPMILSIVGTVGSRIIWIFGFFPSNHDIKYLFLCYPISWVVTIIMQLTCYLVIRGRISRQEKAQGSPAE